MDWCIKNKGVHDRLDKCTYHQNWASRDEERVYLVRRPVVSRKFDKEPEKKSSVPEE
jgi:hypothetical protein